MEVAGGENNIVKQPAALRDLGLEARLVQVLGASFDDLLLMVLDAVKMLKNIFKPYFDATHAQ